MIIGGKQRQELFFPNVGDDVDLQFFAKHFVHVADHILKYALSDGPVLGMMENGLKDFYKIFVFRFEEVPQIVQFYRMFIQAHDELLD